MTDIKPECVGEELIPGIEECFGPSEKLSISMGQAACVGCMRLCIDTLKTTKAENKILGQEVDDLKLDELTGLLTRKSLAARFETLRNEGKPFAVFFMDVVEFAEYNANYGHRGGDIVLKSIGRALQENIRDADSPYILNNSEDDKEQINGVASRRGGDEFVMLIDLSSTNDEATTNERREGRLFNNRSHAVGFADRFLSQFDEWMESSMNAVQSDLPESKRISTSVEFHLGFSVSEVGDRRSLEDLIHEADPDKISRK